ncbi:methyltransferase [Kineosporia sp. J2-2]|uniref:Methyltransferase n=1 Tax=Kineosporia corallincola TaxID=2835133 RepID=A0ABS5T8J0_9ACTN|nr:methyltransferase [Kineosporia corallincola]MBT0767357.1 methyltransferase [Kineosporia corallincola]
MSTDPAELIEKLRSDLAGFTVDSVNELLGPVAQAALGREQSLPARLAVTERLRTEDDEPLAALIAVFVLGLAVPAARLASAVPRTGLDGLAELGLIVTAGSEPGDDVRGLVDLRPYATVDALGPADWWLASDLSEVATGRPLTDDHVLGVGGASLTLARCTVRRPTGRVLDLGTGCGIQALHAARHSRHVVATDISARAMKLARLNWALNAPTVGETSIEGRLGSLLEPVAGELFDQVVSNPPFVITPRSTPAAAFEYRDGGMIGDDLVRQLVESVGSVLAPGGIAQFLGNWEGRRNEGWTDRVTSWLEASGLDGWVVQREWQDPAEYAETWIRDSGQHLGKDADDLYAAWLADFASRGVDGVGFGLITLRRPPTGEPRIRVVEERRTGPGLPWGDEVVATLERQDWLATHDDDALLAGMLKVAADVTEERHHLPGAEDPSVILLRQGGGAGRVVQANTALAGFVGACSGDIPVGRLIAALASLLEVDGQALRAELLGDVRNLVRDGLLEPAP